MSNVSSNFHNVANNRLAFNKKHGLQEIPSNFSWVIENELAGCALPTSRDQILNLGKFYNIGLVVSAIEEEDCPPEEFFINSDIKHQLFEVENFTPPTRKQINDFIEITKKTIEEEKQAVVVHCYGGNGRTGTLLACYFIKEKNLNAHDAIGYVRKIRSRSIESEPQERCIVDFYNFLHPESKQNYLSETFSNPSFLKVKLKSTQN